MKKPAIYACSVLLLLATTPAAAQARWRTFKELPVTYAWDTKTARLVGPYVVAWTISPVLDRQREVTVQMGHAWAYQWVSTRERLMFDCKKLAYKWLDIVELDAEQVPLHQSSFQPSDTNWENAGPDTIMEEKLLNICSYFGR
jgi:hypothetical protein